ncbi:MAG: AMP-binding protein [Actinobacteria bacterium]|nr:AMP-binding protein [Actinomycetota bacterium]
MTTRALVRIPVAPGPRGVQDLIAALPEAFDGIPIAPVPVTSVTVSDTYVAQILQAIRPEIALEIDGVAVVLTTSGSTGSPRGVLLSATALAASAQGAAELVGIPVAESAWLVAIPVTSAGGFAVVVRSWLAGFEPETLPSVGGAMPFRTADFVASTRQLAQRASGRALLTSLVPTQLARILDDVEGRSALNEYSAILVGGARFDSTIRERAQAAGVNVLSTYGLTETCGGCVYDGKAFPGVDVRIASDGEVLVQGEVVGLGYRLDPALTAQRFIEGWLHTGDIGSIDEGTLSIVGRRDDIVTVKGVNVATGAVERVICAIPGVDACAVIATPHPIDGHRLSAFIVAQQDLARTITATVAEQLGPVAAPSSISTIASLPVLPNGKTDRAALAARAND